MAKIQQIAVWCVNICTGKKVPDDGDLYCDLCPAYPRGFWKLRFEHVWVCADCLPAVPTWIALHHAASGLPVIHA